MKPVNNREQSNNASGLAVSVTIDEPSLLKNLVEKLAHRRKSAMYKNQIVPKGLTVIETSSIEAYVSGCMDIQERNGYIALSYTTCFSFTCTKIPGGENTMAWINSLS